MVGIDVSDRSIKVVELDHASERKLRTLCWSPLPAGAMEKGIVQDVGLVATGVREALTRCSPIGVSGQEVTASIPERQSFVRVVEVPKMSPFEMDEAVKWAIRQHIPFDLERVYLDWQEVIVANPNPEMQVVLVGAAQREVVDPLLRVLDELGFRVVGLELEAQAIVRSLLPLDASGVEGVLIVDLSATATNVIYFNRGSIRYTTNIQKGGDDVTNELATALGIEAAQAAEQKALIGVGPQGMQQNPQVATEVQKSVRGLLEQIEQVVRGMASHVQGESGVKTFLLSGGGAGMPGLTDFWQEVFPGIPVQLGNPWTNIAGFESSGGQSPLGPTDVMHFVTALGLASRSAEDFRYEGA